MQKKNTIMWTAIATTAASIAVVYYMRKRKVTKKEDQRRNYITDVSTRARGFAMGEFTL